MVATDVAQFDALQLRPKPLVRVPLGSIGREALQVHPLHGAIGQELLSEHDCDAWGSHPQSSPCGRALPAAGVPERPRRRQHGGHSLGCENTPCPQGKWPRSPTYGRMSPTLAARASAPWAHRYARHWAGDKSRTRLGRRSFGAGLRPPVDGGPGLITPAGNRRFVALADAPKQVLRAPADGLTEAPDVGHMISHPQLAAE